MSVNPRRSMRRRRRSALRGRAVSLVALLILAAFVLLSPLGARGGGTGQATFCLGFILLFGYYLAKMLEAVRLPSITSYILVGVICGPFALNLLSNDVIHTLQRLDDVALAIIALIAGGEMRLSMLRARIGAFSTVIVAQIVFCFVAAVAAIFLMNGRGGLDLQSDRAIIAVGLLFGLVIVARSPATTIGIITEMRAKGPLTELLVSVTVLLDVAILVLAAVIIPGAETLASGEAFSMDFVSELGIHVVGSAVAGLVFGLIVRLYIQWVGGFLPLFLIGVGLVGSAVCHHYHLSPLLSFMIAGFFVENFSRHGEKLIHGLERSAFPVYVLFFSISGASINLQALQATWLLALVLVLVRAAAFFVGSWSAARIVSDLKAYRNNMWSGFLAQAGVTIGIASLIADRFSFGAEIETIVLAVVAINQLIGPIALKILIERVGEAGGMDRR